jgi:prevent-host-death family protein
MDVAVSALRANLSHWLDQVREGEEVVVTERGTPVARIVPVADPALLARLEQQGLIGRPAATVRTPARGRRRVRATESASEAVRRQRD